MNVRFLEAFVWVAKLGSFKGAADKLCTTQAGISSRIATLEEQFGVKLFERDRRNITLTYHGTELLPYAERMIDLQGRMVSAIGGNTKYAGMLRIGAIETVVHTWLPDLLSRFASAYPNVTLEISSDITANLRDDLLRGTVDCVFLAEEITAGFIENRRIANYAMRWATSPTLARQLPQRQLVFSDIASFPIISFHRQSSVYRNISQSAGDLPGLRVSFFSSLAAMIELARSGFGIAPLPLAVIHQDLAQGRLVLLDLAPLPAPLPLIASTRLEPALPLAEALVQMARESSDHYAAQAAIAVLAD